MSRVKRGSIPRQRKRRVFKQTEGFFGGRKNRYREAIKSLRKSWQYSYIGRKLRKRDMRALWIQRINAACREHGTSYSRFMFGLKQANVDLDRKALADLAVHEPDTFKKLTELASQ